ncbi:hypothetical protein MMAD_07820 [Mycolicibacterium madagascariense]|uniref:Uncharacterized protein n=1 Tax=Mycolicibacterium madagascariense TaxID=212765 RepID=A0A7I7XC59_9MYCO|nr:hypothetical protein MMAD_07820 [Mycolicibacterium madagascariense]
MYTRTTGLAAAGVGDADVGVEVELAVVLELDELELLLLLELMDWKPTNRKTTPRKSSTMTMARSGNPEESR